MTHDFHYSHLLPQKPPLIFPDEERMLCCEDCGVEVKTTARVRKRCDSCRKVALDRQSRAAMKRRAARRKAAKGLNQ